MLQKEDLKEVVAEMVQEVLGKGQFWSEPQSLDRLNTIALLELSPVLYWAHSI